MVADSDGQGSRPILLRIKELQKRSEQPGLPTTDRANIAMELGQLYAGLRAVDSAIQWYESAARTFASLGSATYLNRAGIAHSFAADLARQRGDWVTRAEFLRRAAWAFTSSGNEPAAAEARRQAEAPPPASPFAPTESPTGRCERCGSAIAAGSRFCPSCGFGVAPTQVAPIDLAPKPSPDVSVSPTRPPNLETFLKFNAYDRFDLLQLNALDLAEIAQEAHNAPRALLRQSRDLAESLLERVRRETGRREDVAELLGDLAARWCLKISKDSKPLDPPAWQRWAMEAYSGLFYESRVPGGRRKPRLADRLLWTSRGRMGPDDGSRLHLFEKTSESDTSATLQETSAEDVLVLRVAQSVLDDLVASPRSSDSVVPLTRLTSLAASATSREVNAALQSILPAFDEGSFLLLDPSRFPGVSQVVLRWPNERIHPGVSRYDLLVSTKVESASGPVPLGSEASPGTDRLANWFEQVHSGPEWTEILTSLDRQQARLPRPPALAASLRLAGYDSLRKTLVGGSPVTEIFERVRWKDQPRGLPMFNQLLLTGSFSTDFDTDRQYLEVELNELTYGTPKPPSDDGVWKIGGGKVVQRQQMIDGTTRYSVGADSGTTSGAS